MRKFKTESQKISLRRPNRPLTLAAQLTLPGFEVDVKHLIPPTRYQVNFHHQTSINSREI